MKVHVHVGVHKTASTYMQGVLKQNMEALNSAGVGFMPLGQLRPFLTRRLMKFNPREFALESYLTRFFKASESSSADGVVISDENLIGDCREFVLRGRLYPRLELRLMQLRELLSGHDVRLFVALRSYETFLSSAYCEALRHGSFVPFSDFEERLDWDSLRWPDVMRRMIESLEPESVHAWPFEEFREKSPEVMSRLAFGVPVEPIPESGSTERPSFSKRALEALHILAADMGNDVATELVRPVTKALPKVGDDDGFRPLSGEKVEQLRGLYEEDCKMIERSGWLM